MVKMHNMQKKNKNKSPCRYIRTYFGPKYLFFAFLCLISLVIIGCSSTDKGKPTPPFFRDAAPPNQATLGVPTAPPPGSTEPIIVQNGIGPATPSNPGAVFSSNSSAVSTYVPPDMVPASTTANSPISSASNSPLQSTYPGGTTTVYNVPSGTQVNEGASAGSISDAYSSPPNASPYGYGTPASTGGTNYGTPTSTDRSTYDTPTNGTSYDNNYYGPASGHTTSVKPQEAILSPNGNHFLAESKKYRVINGKRYELVKYTASPPVLPDISDFSQPPQVTPMPDFQQVTPLPVTQTSRTASQMTKDWGRRVPMPSYDAMLRQSNIPFGQSQEVFTFTEPVKMTIEPNTSVVEQVTSLEHSQYEHLGAITAPSTVPTGTIDAQANEMQGSIWSIMAQQDNAFLLNMSPGQQQAESQNGPAYFPLSNPLAPYAGTTYSGSGATLSQPMYLPRVTSSGVTFGQPIICCP